MKARVVLPCKCVYYFASASVFSLGILFVAPEVVIPNQTSHLRATYRLTKIGIPGRVAPT